MDSVMPYVLALVPTIGVAALFYVVIKTILEGDRRERVAQAKWEAEHDRAAAAGTSEKAQPSASGISRDKGDDAVEKDSEGPALPRG